MAKRNDLDLWFEDECHFQQHGSRCAMWIPPEDADPVVIHAPTRKKVGVFGAVRVSDGQLIVRKENKFDARSFHDFLKQLLRHRKRGQKMVVVLDNARWHHAQLLKPWLNKHRHAIELNYLPAYSPDLNPIERVWKLTRRLCTHNRYFSTLDELVDVVFDQFAHWKLSNATLKRLCAIS